MTLSTYKHSREIAIPHFALFSICIVCYKYGLNYCGWPRLWLYRRPSFKRLSRGMRAFFSRRPEPSPLISLKRKLMKNETVALDSCSRPQFRLPVYGLRLPNSVARTYTHTRIHTQTLLYSLVRALSPSFSFFLTHRNAKWRAIKSVTLIESRL